MLMTLIRQSDDGFEMAFKALLGTKQENNPEVDRIVADIIHMVRTNGDKALCDYSLKFDDLALSADQLRISDDEIEAYAADTPQALKDAIELAASRIRDFHERQKPSDFHYQDATGAQLGMRWTAMAQAGLYVPGGTASYPSSVLMNAIPAKVAGVKRLAMVVPIPRGEINPLVFYAAKIAGVDEIYRVGGAHAVAALAYGTESLAPVDIITGPGNAYVAAAKRQVFGVVGIDMIAGPSEVMIVADKDANPDWVAADLIAQAEHDTDAQCVLMCDDHAFAAQVDAALLSQLKTLPRAETARESLRKNGFIVLVDDVMQSGPLIDFYAPEHLQLIVADGDSLLQRFSNAGAIFMGAFTPTAMGDYISGPNHVLPTGQSARFASGLSVFDFMKRSTLCTLDNDSFSAIAPSAIRIAQAEGLDGHAKSISIRTNMRS